MKKLIVALGAIAIAVASQAASVRWQSGTIYVAKDAEGTVGNSMANAAARQVTAYLFSVDAATYATDSLLSTEALYTKYIGGNVAATLTGTTTATGAVTLTQTVADGSSENPQSVYGIVLYVDTKTAASYDGVDAFVKSAVGTKTWQDTTGASFSNLAGAKTTNWTAVPEPTSGLLMLLGMAGLALRRRRA